jgi:NADPH2:quinone reductase
MKAVLCKKFGPPESLVVEEVDAPLPAANEVVIEVRAAAVNFPDLLIIQDQYQFKPPLPFIPGAEASGIVIEVGSDVQNRKVGDRVIANKTWGCFAERIAVDAHTVIAVPDSVDFQTAAALLLTYGTSHYALKARGKLKKGETLLVLGAAGGAGLAAVDLGKAMGARVIAAASNDEKLAVCKTYGADEVINYSSENLKERTKELTDGQGADVVYDPVGGDYTEAAVRATNWGGRYLVIGFTAGIPKLPLNLTLLKGCNIVGVFWGSFTVRDPEGHLENMRELMSWCQEGRIRPLISSTYPFEKVADALRELSERRATGKIVLLPHSAGT